jgi:hypothetical protein
MNYLPCLTSVAWIVFWLAVPQSRLTGAMLTFNGFVLAVALLNALGQ